MAIKVNGTTVINDSRALSNIASVDATTAASIGAAGVGGSLEFLSETNITSEVSYIDISFPTGYRGFHIALNRMVFSVSNVTYKDLRLRLKDSSGTLITTTTYAEVAFAGSAGYANPQFSIGKFGPPDPNDGNVNNIGTSFFITMMNPRVSDLQTSYFAYGGGYINNGSAIEISTSARYGNEKTPQDNVGVRIFGDGKNIGSDSKSYSVWGIK